MIIAGTFTQLINIKQPPVPQVPQGDDALPASAEEDESSGEVAAGKALQQIPSQFVGQAGSPSLYVCLTDIRGSAELELRVVDLNNDKVLLKGELVVKCDDPLIAVEAKITLPMINYPHAGAYSFELLYEDELLGSWRVNVRVVDIDDLNK